MLKSLLGLLVHPLSLLELLSGSLLLCRQFCSALSSDRPFIRLALGVLNHWIGAVRYTRTLRLCLCFLLLVTLLLVGLLIVLLRICLLLPVGLLLVLLAVALLLRLLVGLLLCRRLLILLISLLLSIRLLLVLLRLLILLVSLLLCLFRLLAFHAEPAFLLGGPRRLHRSRRLLILLVLLAGGLLILLVLLAGGLLILVRSVTVGLCCRSVVHVRLSGRLSLARGR